MKRILRGEVFMYKFFYLFIIMQVISCASYSTQQILEMEDEAFHKMSQISNVNNQKLHVKITKNIQTKTIDVSCEENLFSFSLPDEYKWMFFKKEGYLLYGESGDNVISLEIDRYDNSSSDKEYILKQEKNQLEKKEENGIERTQISERNNLFILELGISVAKMLNDEHYKDREDIFFMMSKCNKENMRFVLSFSVLKKITDPFNKELYIETLSKTFKVN